MRLYTVFIVAIIAVTVQAAGKVEKEKRRAQNYGSGTTALYNTVTATPVFTPTETSPVYNKIPKINYVSQPVSYEQQQITVQQPVKVAYSQPVYNQKLSAAPQQQFSYSFEAQPQVQQQGIKYAVSQPQESVKYVAQPEVKYVAQQDAKYAFSQPQQEVKYAYVQPAAGTGKIVAAAPAVAKVSYPSQVVYTQSQPQVQAVQPHYSPAGSVSSFSFSSPHVTYSNLGLLSQVVGKGYTAPQAAQQQVTYVAQPGAPNAQYIAAANTHYVAPAPATQNVQYVAAPQSQHSAQQLVYVPQVYAHAPKSGVTYA